MITVYVIQDEHGNLYKGQTQDIQTRLKEHNNGKTKTTSKSKNWKLVYSEEYKTREEAVEREKYLKTAAGRRFIKSKI